MLEEVAVEMNVDQVELVDQVVEEQVEVEMVE